MYPRPLVLSVALLLAPACAVNDKDVCPESQGMRCAGAPDCTRDSSRGCRVCQCNTFSSPTPVYTPLRAPNDPGRVPDPTLPPR